MTVSQSQIAIPTVKVSGRTPPPDAAGPVKISVIAMNVVSTAPTSTMNMTGLRHISRGSSLRNAPGMPAMS